MPEREDLSPEDIALFRAAVGSVDRLPQQKVRPTGARPEPLPNQTLADRQQALRDSLHGHPTPCEVETGEELHFIRAGVQRRLLRKLRRGQFSIRAELDLHGLTVDAAYERLVAFLQNCRSRDIRCIRVIHGKGHGSKHGRPVLKGKIDRWLRLRNEVIAFCSAPPMDGGTGALYVLLKKR